MFRVLDGRSIRIDAKGPLSSALAHTLNPALALLLARRGHQILHGGAVALGRACAVVLGPPGAGKSSLVLEAARGGLDLISDEIVPFRIGGGKLVCPGGNPIIRVDSGLLAGGTGGREPGHGRKRMVDVRQWGGGFSGRCSRVALFVFLGERQSREGPAFHTEPMATSEALLGLLANTYNRRVLGEAEWRRSFRTYAAAVRTVPACRFRVRNGLDALPEAAKGLSNLLAAAPSAFRLQNVASARSRYALRPVSFRPPPPKREPAGGRPPV